MNNDVGKDRRQQLCECVEQVTRLFVESNVSKLPQALNKGVILDTMESDFVPFENPKLSL